MSLNVSKSVTMIYKPYRTARHVPHSFPDFTLNGVILNTVDSCKYLGHIISATDDDNLDIVRQMGESVCHDKRVERCTGSDGDVMTMVEIMYCCVYTSHIARRQYLEIRSASCRQPLLPRHRCSMFDRRTFSVAGPAAWNSLPDYVRDPTRFVDRFRHDLKTLLISFY